VGRAELAALLLDGDGQTLDRGTLDRTAAVKLYNAAIDKYEAVLEEEPGLLVAQYRCALAMQVCVFGAGVFGGVALFRRCCVSQQRGCCCATVRRRAHTHTHMPRNRHAPATRINNRAWPAC
jgi:hypothetical protein